MKIIDFIRPIQSQFETFIYYFRTILDRDSSCTVNQRSRKVNQNIRSLFIEIFQRTVQTVIQYSKIHTNISNGCTFPSQPRIRNRSHTQSYRFITIQYIITLSINRNSCIIIAFQIIITKLTIRHT